MSTAVGGIYVVGVSQNQLTVAVGVLHGHFDFAGFLDYFKIYDVRMDRVLVFVLEFYELFDSAFVVESFAPFLTLALVLEDYLYSLVEESHLAESVLQGAVIENGGFKYFWIRPERGL